ncbi:MAG: glycosyltransferase family 2 protein [Gemmatimonadaceae bacterium]
MTKSTDRVPDISVVTPMYGEAGSIDTLLPALRGNLSAAHVTFEVIVIDDGSSDQTWNTLRQKAGGFPELRAARLSRNFGKEASVRAGLEMARGNAVIVMDSDMQHPPALLPEMIRFWRDGAQIVEAVKANRDVDSAFQRSMSRTFNRILYWLSGMDMMSSTDFRLLDRQVVEALLSMEERNAFFRGMTTWLGFERRQVSFDVPARASGKPAWSAFGRAKLAVSSIAAFSATPLYLVHLIGALFLIFAAGLSAQTLYMKFYGGARSGFTTVIIVLLVIGSAIMFSLGIIGDYIGRIYTEVQRRPRYVISERIEQSEEAAAAEPRKVNTY